VGVVSGKWAVGEPPLGFGTVVVCHNWARVEDARPTSLLALLSLAASRKLSSLRQPVNLNQMSKQPQNG